MSLLFYGAEPALNNLSEFRGPPHTDSYAPRISFFLGHDEVLIKARSDQTFGFSPFDNYTYKLDELTKDIVEEKALELIHKSLSATS